MSAGKGYAIASFVLGLFSVIAGWIPLIGWLIIILALVLGILAVRTLKKEASVEGKPYAIAGITMASIGLLLAALVMAIVISNLRPELSPILDRNESGGTLHDWKERILSETGSTSEPSRTIAQCEAALDQSVVECATHEGWRTVHVMEVTDFKIDKPYHFQEIRQGGCPENSPDGQEYPKTAETATMITQSGASTAYQVGCNIVCNWWTCTEKTEPKREPETWTGTIAATLEDLGDACGGAEVSITYDITLHSPGSLISALNGDQEITLWSEPNYKDTSGTIKGTATVDIQPPRTGVIYCELEDGQSANTPLVFYATGGTDQKIQLAEVPGAQKTLRIPVFAHKYYYHEDAGLTDDSPLAGFPPILEPKTITATEISGFLRPRFGYTGTFMLRKE